MSFPSFTSSAYIGIPLKSKPEIDEALADKAYLCGLRFTFIPFSWKASFKRQYSGVKVLQVNRPSLER